MLLVPEFQIIPVSSLRPPVFHLHASAQDDPQMTMNSAKSVVPYIFTMYPELNFTPLYDHPF